MGENCPIYSRVRNYDCEYGTICAKCPEHWNSVRMNATCVCKSLFDSSQFQLTILILKKTAITAAASPRCPKRFQCGYMATCFMLDVTPTCVCPENYKLEDNLLDCYGWTNISKSECSTTCGTGYVSVNRSCDRASGSSASCEGPSEYTESCRAPVQCPCKFSLTK